VPSAARTAFQLALKVYERKFTMFYLVFCTMTNPATETKSTWAAGRRAGALFFAHHLDYFIVTQNSHPSPGLGTVKTNYRDKKLIVHLPGLAKKRGTATQTAPN
jgi:hypothetical protein